MQAVALPTKTSPHVLADQTATLLTYWPEVEQKAPQVPGVWWLVTRPLAQAVEAVGEVVVTDGWSDWWYAKGERPEDALEALGLADFLG